MRKTIGGLLGAMLIAGVAQAADRPVAPPTPPVDPLNAPAVSTRFARNFTLGALDNNLGQVSLYDLRTTLGMGSLDSIQGISWLCFDLPRAGQRLWLSSSNPSGFIETVTMGRIGSASSRCPALPAKYQSIAVDDSLRIGMTRAELMKRLGQPSRQIDTWSVYSAQQSGGRQGLAVQFINDKAAFIAVTHLSQ